MAKKFRSSLDFIQLSNMGKTFTVFCLICILKVQAQESHCSKHSQRKTLQCSEICGNNEEFVLQNIYQPYQISMRIYIVNHYIV